MDYTVEGADLQMSVTRYKNRRG